MKDIKMEETNEQDIIVPQNSINQGLRGAQDSLPALGGEGQDTEMNDEGQ